MNDLTYIQHEGYVEVPFSDDFDMEKTFECGQCFRWNREKDGSYTGVALQKALTIQKVGESLFLSGTGAELEDIWWEYFDLSVCYRDIRASLCVDDYMCAAASFGSGIRILRQDKWEALCSFILSQCNNIPRIKAIIEKLCCLFGEEIQLGDRRFFTFPTAERVAALSLEELAPLRCGYRAPYILRAAKTVSSGELDLEKLTAGDFAAVMASLKAMSGIGDKVASCVMLFALHRLDAFPVDVWMKKAIQEHYGDEFSPQVFGEYAGLAQQYMFYYQRSGEGKKKA